MFKGFTTEVAQEVGKSGAILLNQLLQWFKSQNVEKVYRTNSELAEDLGGILSVATIQRAKVALVDAGYITVSFDKGLNRTTHYSLTEKAKSVLGLLKEAVVKVAEKVAEKATQVIKPNKPSKPKCTSPVQQHTPKAMQESFNEGFGNDAAVPCPPTALEKLRGLLKGKKSTEDGKVPVEVAPSMKYQEDDSDLFPKKTSVLDNPDDISDEEYFKSVDSIFGMAYNGVPNVEIRNENLRRAEAMSNFKGEDW